MSGKQTEKLRKAIARRIEKRKLDEVFQWRLRKVLSRNRDLYDKLAEVGEQVDQ